MSFFRFICHVQRWTRDTEARDRDEMLLLLQTCYRALSPELIPVYRQLSPGGRLPLLSARPAFYLRKRSPDGATPNWGNRHLITAYYSFIDPEKRKGWVGLVGWPIADGLPTSGHPSAKSRAEDKESSPARDWRSTTEPGSQLDTLKYTLYWLQ